MMKKPPACERVPSVIKLVDRAAEKGGVNHESQMHPLWQGCTASETNVLVLHASRWEWIGDKSQRVLYVRQWVMCIFVRLRVCGR